MDLNARSTAHGQGIYTHPADEGSFRLLRPSSTQSDEVTCELKWFELRTAPPYAALSYSWGAGARERVNLNIAVDQKAPSGVSYTIKGLLRISQDLESAIRKVHSHSKDDWLWIDAICIDQGSRDERALQVRIMDKIYASAGCVFVWLGEASYDDRNVWDHELLESAKVQDGLSYTKILALLNQNERVWWSRLWIVQEVAVAQKVTVCIGQYTLPWDDFVEALWGKPEEFYVHPRHLLGAGDDEHAKQQQLYDKFQAMRHQVLHLSNMRNGIQKSKGRPLLELLRESVSCHASNPLDRIYGLLGLATREDRQGIPITYYPSPARVFGTAGASIAQTAGSLEVLVDQWPRFCGKPFDFDDNSLPSWVPNFAGAVQISPRPLAWAPRLAASGLHKPKIKVGWYELQMAGLRFDEVTRVWRDMCEDMDEYTTANDHISRLLNTVLPVAQAIVLGKPDPDFRDGGRLASLDKAHRFWRTLAADFGPTDDIPPEEASAKDAIIGLLLDKNEADIETVYQLLGYHKDRAEGLAAQICTSLKGRVLFSTANGFLGVTSPEILEGDVVVVAFGAPVPFLLRRMPNQIEGFESYTLVHACNVNGIMHGEMMKLYDRGQIQSEIFSLY